MTITRRVDVRRLPTRYLGCYECSEHGKQWDSRYMGVPKNPCAHVEARLNSQEKILLARLRRENMGNLKFFTISAMNIDGAELTRHPNMGEGAWMCSECGLQPDDAQVRCEHAVRAEKLFRELNRIAIEDLNYGY